MSKRVLSMMAGIIGPKAQGVVQMIERDEIDELLTLCDIYPDEVPNRISSLLETYDKNFESNPERDMTYKNNFEYSRRINNLVHSALRHTPDSEETGATDENLIPTFTLSSDDKERVLKKCSDMRKIVLASSVFDNPHKNRLLNRIAAIERQVNQEKGLFDVVRSGVSDVGETLGKFGVDIKPLTDRMNEVAGIVRRATPEYDQIPPPEEVEALPKPDAEEC